MRTRLVTLLGVLLVGLSGGCWSEGAPVATLAPGSPTTSPSPMPSSLGRVAYVQGGDVWVQDLAGGEPLRLTEDGRNSEPRWAASGQWLAFRKDAQVWLARDDGADLHSVDHQAPVSVYAWSPGTDRLAYVAGSGILRLAVVDADGTNSVVLIPPEEGVSGVLGRVAWSPDGEWIAYEWREGTAYQRLWKISVDGQRRRELYSSGLPERGEAILAGWSGDGQHVLFWQGDVPSASIQADGVGLYSLPADGGEPTRLVDTMLIYPGFVAQAPQGDRLAVAAGGYRGTWTNKRIALVSGASVGPTRLTDERVAACSPAWSPDGSRLAYVAMPDRGDLGGGEDAQLGMLERAIWIVAADGSGRRELTANPAYRDERPLWSADGSHLLFVRLDGEGRISLWLVPTAGGEPQQVVGEVSPPSEASDGWFGYYGYVAWEDMFDWWRG